MKYDQEDAAILEVDVEGTFASDGHYPIIAGYTAAGEPLYYSWINLVESYRTITIAIPSDVTRENIKLKVYKEDGSIAIAELASDGDLYIVTLRYDPHAYDSSELHASRGKTACGMDATGPFSWKFHRALPDIQPQEQLDPDKASFYAPQILWVETLVERSQKEEIIESSSDEFAKENDGLSDAMRETQAWNEHRVTTLLDKY